MKKMTKKFFALSALCAALTACGLFDKDNTPTPTPLTSFTPAAKVQPVWNTSTGFGVGNEYLKLVPAITEQNIFTAGKDGTVTAVNKATGDIIWRVNVGRSISSGVAAHDHYVFVGSSDGYIVALDQANGRIHWQKQTSTEMLATPAADNDVVVAKTMDGKVTALSEKDGHTLWNYQQAEPTLILRSASAPVIKHGSVILGFANGNLTKLSLRDGSLHWEKSITPPEGIFSIQRMIDIAADPVELNNRIYVATYQGKIAALDSASSRVIWTEDTSTYSGIAADNHQVYVSDANGRVTAFNAENGASAWRQAKLVARNITGPAVMGHYIVVGDNEGYLHWLNKQDGSFAARVRVSNSGIVAAPIVENGILYVFTRDGHLASYTLSTS